MRLTTLGTLLLALSSACGDQLVQYQLDGGNGNGSGSGSGSGSNNDGGNGDGNGSSAAPTVIANSPLNMATNIGVNRTVTATFSEPMNASTLTTTTFTVMQGANPVAGTVTYSGTTATFDPTNPLSISLPYTARITTGARDTMGQALASDHVWTFSTGACGQAPINLRSAGSFAVLASTMITNTGLTTVTGNLGLSPGTAAEVTGFPPGILVGTQHAGNPTAATAIADLTTAYNDADSRSLCAMTVAGNLGGQTLTPGLYISTSSLGVTSGDLTLDAQGDADAVFIFEMASTLTTTTGRQVILAGNANAANIYWQVGSSATLGTNSVFKGTIMADISITITNGATLTGRALARTGAVTLDANTIVRP